MTDGRTISFRNNYQVVLVINQGCAPERSISVCVYHCFSNKSNHESNAILEVRLYHYLEKGSLAIIFQLTERASSKQFAGQEMSFFRDAGSLKELLDAMSNDTFHIWIHGALLTNDERFDASEFSLCHKFNIMTQENGYYDSSISIFASSDNEASAALFQLMILPDLYFKSIMLYPAISKSKLTLSSDELIAALKVNPHRELFLSQFRISTEQSMALARLDLPIRLRFSGSEFEDGGEAFCKEFSNRTVQMASLSILKELPFDKKNWGIFLQSLKHHGAQLLLLKLELVKVEMTASGGHEFLKEAKLDKLTVSECSFPVDVLIDTVMSGNIARRLDFSQYTEATEEKQGDWVELMKAVSSSTLKEIRIGISPEEWMGTYSDSLVSALRDNTSLEVFVLSLVDPRLVDASWEDLMLALSCHASLRSFEVEEFDIDNYLDALESPLSFFLGFIVPPVIEALKRNRNLDILLPIDRFEYDENWKGDPIAPHRWLNQFYRGVPHLQRVDVENYRLGLFGSALLSCHEDLSLVAWLLHENTDILINLQSDVERNSPA